MQAERYVVNMAQDVVPVDENNVAVISTMGRFSIKGANMPTAISDILEYFRIPAHFESLNRNRHIYGG
jgi:hypothetical protein